MYTGNRQVVNGMSLTMKNCVNVAIGGIVWSGCFQDNYFLQFSTYIPNQSFAVCTGF